MPTVINIEKLEVNARDRSAREIFEDIEAEAKRRGAAGAPNPFGTGDF